MGYAAGAWELEHDCLSISRNRKQLIISRLLIWISPTHRRKKIFRWKICYHSSLPVYFLSVWKFVCLFSWNLEGFVSPIAEIIDHLLFYRTFYSSKAFLGKIIRRRFSGSSFIQQWNSRYWMFVNDYAIWQCTGEYTDMGSTD